MDKETKKWLAVFSILLAVGVIVALLLMGGRISGIHIPGRFKINLN